VTGWVALAGFFWAVARLTFGRRSPADVFVLLCLVFVLLFEFMPHKLTLTGYYSHPRAFRYLATIVPVVYLPAAYWLDAIWGRVRPAGVVVLVMAAVFNLLQVPVVTEPSTDPNSEGRALVRFLKANLPDENETIHADHAKCKRISGLLQSKDRPVALRCIVTLDKSEQRKMLLDITEGIVVTGGAEMAWYGDPAFLVNLSELDLSAPSHWTLIFHREGPLTPWRREPLAVWKVEPRPPQEGPGAADS
jgi:hypothetical protein